MKNCRSKNVLKTELPKKVPVTTGTIAAPQAAALGAGAGQPAGLPACAAIQAASSPEAPSCCRSAESGMMTWAMVACPADSGSSPALISRCSASASASC
jgi:hypothetical protein